MIEKTSKGMRLHIGIFGKSNTGKSSLLNAITRQSVSIVSEIAGTTTDPVEKPMELLPLGPVLFIDTAGIDDSSALGVERIARTRRIFDRVDIALIVSEANEWGTFESDLLDIFTRRKTPVIVVINKIDMRSPSADFLSQFSETQRLVTMSAKTGEGLPDLKDALIALAPEDFVNTPAIAHDLVGKGEMAILVIPIDKEAPKGRLILPQVQTMRDLLDGDAYCTVVKEDTLPLALANLKKPPKLVVTDSQAFARVAADTPENIPLTGFSVLFARYKGDLVTQAKNTMAVATLKPGDKILIAESCTHHPIEDDIGRVKIPKWLENHVGGALQFDVVQGHDFPENLGDYQLAIHCGACMTNRRAVLRRLERCQSHGVPMTNYGLLIAYLMGIFERVLRVFPEAHAACFENA